MDAAVTNLAVEHIVADGQPETVSARSTPRLRVARDGACSFRPAALTAACLMSDLSRLNAVYQYTVAVAALADDARQQSLGPIHLLKYAYLADLAHASRRAGSPYSGVEWRFHHFGPWSQEAFNAIGPALHAVAAREDRYTSRYESDVVRFGLDRHRAEAIARRGDQDLPPVVSHAITRAVREHGTDTADLLRHVYLTPPMLAARPGDRLDFSTAASVVRETQTPHAPARLTVKEKRRRAAIIDSARAEVRQRLAKSRSKRAAPQRAPRYDAVFREGTAQLDRLAGDPIVPATGEITFDDSVWHASN